MRAYQYTSFLLITALVGIWNCASNNDDDGTSPFVTAVFPEHEAVSVPITVQPTATFNEAIEFSGNRAVYLSVDGNNLFGTVSHVDGLDNAIELALNGNLQPLTNHYLIIDGSKVSDLSGNEYREGSIDTVAAFVTGVDPMSNPPDAIPFIQVYKGENLKDLGMKLVVPSDKTPTGTDTKPTHIELYQLNGNGTPVFLGNVQVGGVAVGDTLRTTKAMPEAGTVYRIQAAAVDAEGNKSEPVLSNAAPSKGYTLEGKVVEAVRNNAGEHLPYKDINSIMQDGQALFFTNDNGKLTLEAKYPAGGKGSSRVLAFRGDDFIEVRVPYNGAVANGVKDLKLIPTWGKEAPLAETIDVYSVRPNDTIVHIAYVWGGGENPEVGTLYVNLGARSNGYDKFNRMANVMQDIGGDLVYLESVKQGVNTIEIPVESGPDEGSIINAWLEKTDDFGHPNRHIMIMGSQHDPLPNNATDIESRKGYGSIRVGTGVPAAIWAEMYDQAAQTGDSEDPSPDGYWNVDTPLANDAVFPSELLDEMENGPVSSVAYQLPDGSMITMSKEELNLHLIYSLFNQTGLNDMTQDEYAALTPRPEIELNRSPEYILLPAPKKFAPQ